MNVQFKSLWLIDQWWSAGHKWRKVKEREKMFFCTKVKFQISIRFFVFLFKHSYWWNWELTGNLSPVLSWVFPPSVPPLFTPEWHHPLMSSSDRAMEPRVGCSKCVYTCCTCITCTVCIYECLMCLCSTCGDVIINKSVWPCFTVV